MAREPSLERTADSGRLVVGEEDIGVGGYIQEAGGHRAGEEDSPADHLDGDLAQVRVDREHHGEETRDEREERDEEIRECMRWRCRDLLDHWYFGRGLRSSGRGLLCWLGYFCWCRVIHCTEYLPIGRQAFIWRGLRRYCSDHRRCWLRSSFCRRSKDLHDEGGRPPLI